MFESVACSQAPGAIGPYSQATAVGDLVFVSGQLPVDVPTGRMPEGAAAQAEQSLRNVRAILESAGLGMGHVVKSLVFVQDLADFEAVNTIYGQFFEDKYPARSCVQVARLPKDALVEIEVIAHR